MPHSTAQQATPTPPAIPILPAVYRLELKRIEIRDQLKELTQQRIQLQAQRATVSASSPLAKDLDDRIAKLDARSAKLQTDLFATNDLITSGLSAPDGRMTAQEARDAFREDVRSTARNTSRSAGIGIASVLAVVIMWRAIKSFFPNDRRTEALPDNSAQLAQLQQSLDAIAVEVERISEAQRYAAKLTSQRGIGAGEAQPVAVPLRESAAAKTGR